jgi:hypothetical protein
MFTSHDFLRGDDNVLFYQRTLLGTSANQKRHYLSSYNNMYCIYSKGKFIFEKNINLEEHQLIQREGFISLAIRIILMLLI